tara:strand:- start:142 stop:531 length:390 start_codon:yes stop_codon:yes gene_type:complete
MKSQIQLIIFILFSNLFSENRDILFESIEKYLNKYRYTIQNDDFQTKDGIIRLEITSRRTNINSQVLLGFYAIGRSLNKTNLFFNEIHIIINYDSYNRNKEIIIAPVNIVQKLSIGNISSVQFLNLIEL